MCACMRACVRACVCVFFFSLPNRWTNQAEILCVVSKYLGEHYSHVGVTMDMVLS